MEYLKSPMNYIGNKYRLLGQILPLFPGKPDVFVDLFAGGLDVAVNFPAGKTYCNDINYHLMGIYQAFADRGADEVIRRVDGMIDKYGLSKTNRDGFNDFRDWYNASERDPVDLYTLINYSFNYQIRFNSDHDFNCPFGKDRSSFNDNLRKRLPSFIEGIKNFTFTAVDFRKFDYSILKSGDFIYCDPPYTISTGSYNDGKRGFKGWGKNDDADLMSILDRLSLRGVKFAMSNVLKHKGQTNYALAEWVKNYTVHYLDYGYGNSSYQLLDKNTETVEVLITND